MKNFLLISLISISCIFAQTYEVLVGIENINESNNTLDIRLVNPIDVGGIQIGFSGITISNPVNTYPSGFMYSGSGTTLIGFSLTGGSIEAGSSILATLTFSGDPSDIALDLTPNTGTIISDSGGNSLIAAEYVSGLSGYWCAESDFDACGICYFDNAGICNNVAETICEVGVTDCGDYINDDGETVSYGCIPDHFLFNTDYEYEENSACTGCMDSEAENFNVCSYINPFPSCGDISCDNEADCEGNDTSKGQCNDSWANEEIDVNCTIACMDCCAAASDVLGCMDATACNYNADATVNGDDPATLDIDESCWFANEGCACGDSEGSVADCAGICNGSATVDCAGVCNGDSVIDACDICGGAGMDDCGECPGDNNLYGYSGMQSELGGENSTCTGCMDVTATNYNSTVGDPIQSSNECSGDGCSISCEDADGDGSPDCCYYEVDSNTITVTWDLTVVKDTTTTDADGNSVSAVYMEIKDLTEGIEAVYRNWWFSAIDSLYLSNENEVNYFFTDVGYGDSTDVKLQIITSNGTVFEKSEKVELKAPNLLSSNNFIPTKVWLSDNYPNPFNPVTSIEYSVEKGGNVNISIYNVMGHKVFDLVSGYHSPGIRYGVAWNSNTQSNIPVSTGIYFYEMRSGDYVERKKMVLVK